MKQHLMTRLDALKSEFESGKKMLAEQEAKQVKLRESLLRISGAIQVLEEELNTIGEIDRKDNIESLDVAKKEVSQDRAQQHHAASLYTGSYPE